MRYNQFLSHSCHLTHTMDKDKNEHFNWKNVMIRRFSMHKKAEYQCKHIIIICGLYKKTLVTITFKKNNSGILSLFRIQTIGVLIHLIKLLPTFLCIISIVDVVSTVREFIKCDCCNSSATRKVSATGKHNSMLIMFDGFFAIFLHVLPISVRKMCHA